MASETSSPVRITPVGGVACATFAWRSGGQLRVAAIVKATFALVPDGTMLPVEPEPIARRDRHHRDDPARSVEAACDLVPYLAHADVLLRGHAHAFDGRPAPSVIVRLAVARADRSLLDKRLVVRGNNEEGSAAPAPFQSMPILYEHAAGGPHVEENPVGVDVSRGKGANVVDPARPHHPAGFGPTARSWPHRRRLLGAFDPRRLDEPIVELPDGFRWDYFQAAPLDQRTELLRGDEWIALEGMYPTIPRLTTRLPGARGVARVYGPRGESPEGRPLALVADTLTIDADRRRCSVVWRGNFPVGGENDLSSIEVYAGLESASTPVEWPRVAPARAPDELETIGISRTLAEVLARQPATPFARAPQAPAAPVESPVSAGSPGGGPRPAPMEFETIGLSHGPQALLASAPVLPFVDPPPGAAPSPWASSAPASPPAFAERERARAATPDFETVRVTPEQARQLIASSPITPFERPAAAPVREEPPVQPPMVVPPPALIVQEPLPAPPEVPAPPAAVAVAVAPPEPPPALPAVAAAPENPPPEPPATAAPPENPLGDKFAAAMARAREVSKRAR